MPAMAQIGELDTARWPSSGFAADNGIIKEVAI
jgi:hypothetical protein